MRDMVADNDKDVKAPNTNLARIVSIEGLASQINTHLEALIPTDADQQEAKAETREVFAVWQRLNLGELRKVFE